MDGLTLIREARSAGLQVAAEGDKLVVRGPKRAESLARKLIDHKPVVLAVLREPIAEPAPINETRGERRDESTVSDDPADWRELYEEWAAMRQYRGRYCRDVAELLAWGAVIEAWCERHPLPHHLDICAGCGQPLAADVLDLPDGARIHWERHCEFRCLVAYGFARKRRAIDGLATLGLLPPEGWSP